MVKLNIIKFIINLVQIFYDFYVIKLGINQNMKSLLFPVTEFIVSTYKYCNNYTYSIVIINNGYNKNYFYNLE